MSFSTPWALILLVPLLWWSRFSFRLPRVPGVHFPARSIAARIRPSWRRRLLPARRLLRLFAGALVVFCLAGPRQGHEEVLVSAEGIDIQLVLDTSSSMTRTDLAAGKSRLEVAREVIERFVQGRSQDRIGLLTFAKYPRLICPLTLDHDALTNFLRRVRPVPASAEENTTAIGVALAKAVLRLKEDQDRTRVVVLLTDGEEMEHDVEPFEAAELARAYGIKVYAIAVAMRTGRWAREMRQLGESTGGRGFVATDARALAAVYERIDRLERQQVFESRFTEWSERYADWLPLTLLFMLFELGLDLLYFRRIP